MAGPMGMGGAYSAATHDTSALIWNPAGLARLATPEIGISYLDLYGVLGYSFIGVAHPIRSGKTLAASLLTSSDTEGISQERILLFSAATRLWKQWHVGINVKYLTTSVNLEQVPLGRGAGWGADIGFQYARMMEKIHIGVVFPNLFSSVSYNRLDSETSNTYSESLLREWRVGAAIEVDVPKRKSDTMLAAFEITDAMLLIGCEYRYRTEQGTFPFRLGWRFTAGFTAGFGYRHGNIGLDYAFVSGKYGNPQTSLFSVRLFY